MSTTPAMITRFEAVSARIAGLYTMKAPALRAEVERHHRVVDLRGVGKAVLVSMILEAEFGPVVMKGYASWLGQQG